MSQAVIEVAVPHPKGCAGRQMRISGSTAPICYGCARYGLAGPQIAPTASFEPNSQVWQCEERLGDFSGHEGALAR